DSGFTFSIQMGGHFIQDEDGGLTQQGTGEGDALALPDGEQCATFPDPSVVALWQAFNEFV
ncbi:MAG: hypothetical protein BKPUNTRY_002567, partial [Candidatus Fervidibacter sp.]